MMPSLNTISKIVGPPHLYHGILFYSLYYTYYLVYLSVVCLLQLEYMLLEDRDLVCILSA
jgi:hypothetical protein